MSEPQKTKALDIKALAKIFDYVRPYKWVFIGAFLLTLVLAGLTSLRPILIKYGIDTYIAEQNSVGLRNLIILLFGLLVIESVLQFVFLFSANYLGQNIIKDVRVRLYRHLIRFKLRFYDSTPIGTLVTRAVSDIETIADIFSSGILVIMGDLLKIIVMIVAMYVIFDWKLVTLVLTVVPLMFYVTRWFQIAIKKTFQEVRNQVANLNAFVQEHLSGMNIVQVFAKEEEEYGKFVEVNEKHRKSHIKSIWYFSLFLPFIEILSAIAVGLGVWYGGMQAAVGGDVTLGDLTAIIIFINMLFRPLRQLADRFNTLQMGIVASDRVFKLLEDQDNVEAEGTATLGTVSGTITFKDVHFAYIQDEPVLRGVDFTITPGQTFAIVGATGAGKSTIISLLMRFYDIQKGQILLEGKDISTLSLNSLRKHFALVLQDVFLFSDSIYNNITLGEAISEATVWEAAEAIGADEFIKELSGGLSYNVKERGGMLSAGQRQLLAFLRAYVTNPSILILDEATSSIDSHTETMIQRAIDVVTKDRTSVIIAHRLATIKKADVILVMDRGRVVEQGNHTDLLQRGGYYANLYEQQFKEQEGVV
ncbi:MAG: ABC transporter ATP-binding protein/permease [Schleiferiaceae bacterium]|nr:ABC transporter ATP-binding protein/permease [Schleiferiaceae bacterium]